MTNNEFLKEMKILAKNKHCSIDLIYKVSKLCEENDRYKATQEIFNFRSIELTYHKIDIRGTSKEEQEQLKNFLTSNDTILSEELNDPISPDSTCLVYEDGWVDTECHEHLLTVKAKDLLEDYILAIL